MIQKTDIEHNDVLRMVEWLHKNVATSRTLSKPAHVSVISRTLYYFSVDENRWSVKYFQPRKLVQITGLTNDEEVMFRLSF